MDDLVEKLQEKIGSEFADSSLWNTSSNQVKDPLIQPLQLKRTVCYIVSAVVIEDGKVLMMREAKKRCRGLWYLPAGRVELNESLVEAVKREVLEETGLIFEPTSLVGIEGPTLDWLRFNFTGKITGGKLKTVENQDKESMEAGWFPTDDVLNNRLQLRAGDICKLIKWTKSWNDNKKSDPFFSVLPRQKPHCRITIKVILIAQHRNGMKVLVDQKSQVGLLEISSTTTQISVFEVASFLIKRALKGEDGFQIIGILRVEHCAGPQGVSDGTDLTILAELVNLSSVDDHDSSSRNIWVTIDDESMKGQLKKLCAEGCMELK